MANVPGDATTVFNFYETITRLVDQRTDLESGLIQSLLRMTLKAPILANEVLNYLSGCPQAIECLSRKYMVDIDSVEECVFKTMIRAN